MTTGIHQPYLFPYIAYWQLIGAVDCYVISDEMKFIRHGYINRNNILMEGKCHQFSLEVIGAHSGKKISEVEVGNNAKKILKMIFHVYKKAPYFTIIYPLIEKVLLNDEKNLAKHIGYSIEEVSRYLEIDTKIIYLSDMENDYTLKAQARVIDICKRLSTDCYINAIGGVELYDKKKFMQEGIELKFLKSEIQRYKQFDNTFVPSLSIIDIMMFNPQEEIKRY